MDKIQSIRKFFNQLSTKLTNKIQKLSPVRYQKRSISVPFLHFLSFFLFWSSIDDKYNMFFDIFNCHEVSLNLTILKRYSKYLSRPVIRNFTTAIDPIDVMRGFVDVEIQVLFRTTGSQCINRVMLKSYQHIGIVLVPFDQGLPLFNKGFLPRQCLSIWN